MLYSSVSHSTFAQQLEATQLVKRLFCDKYSTYKKPIYVVQYDDSILSYKDRKLNTCVKVRVLKSHKQLRRIMKLKKSIYRVHITELENDKLNSEGVILRINLGKTIKRLPLFYKKYLFFIVQAEYYIYLKKNSNTGNWEVVKTSIGTDDLDKLISPK